MLTDLYLKRWFLLCLFATLAAPTIASAQTSSFRPYRISGEDIDEAATRLDAELRRANVSSEIIVDRPKGRLFVGGPEASQQIAQQVLQSRTAKPARPNRFVDSSTISQPAGDLRWRVAQQKAALNPNDVLLPTSQDTKTPSKNSNQNARESSTQPETSSTADPIRSVSTTLKSITWQELITAIESVSPRKLAFTQDPQTKTLSSTLYSQKGKVTIAVQPSSGRLTLQGPASVANAWLEAIRFVDKPSERNSGAVQMVSVDRITPETVMRTVSIVQQAGTNPRRATRWGGDVVGFEGEAAASSEPVRTAQAQRPATPASEEPTQPTDPAAPAEPTQEAEEPAAPLGVEGGLMGPVQIEFVEGLDAIIVRGRRPDVERILKIIDDLERLSAETEPVIELVPLEHVSSRSLAELIDQLNSEALAARRGSVYVTPLIKPNSLLVVGRPESVEATIELIKRLDQPVAPASQFHIIRLEHMAAVDAQTTIEQFFAEREGLGTQIEVQADYRTNSIILYGGQRDLQEVVHLVEQLDVVDSKAVNEVRVFKLRNALAEELAPVLQATLLGEAVPATTAGPGAAGAAATPAGGDGASARSSMLTLTRLDAAGNKILKSGILTSVRVAADARANSLVVTAPSESMDLISALVKQLDELPTAEAQIKVFAIVNGDATSLTEMLRELFEADTGDGPIQSAAGTGESSLVGLRFSVDPRTNSIIATGTSSDLSVVEAILLRLDASDLSQRRTRVYRLQNAPALDVATAINELLRTERQIALVAPETISPFEQIEREVVVVPEVVSNSLIISATPRYFDKIIEIVTDLDERPPMVLIQVLIAEVALNNVEQLGVELGIQDSLLFDRSVVTDVVTPGFNFNNQPLGNSSSPSSLASREKTAGQALTDFAVGRVDDQLGYGGLVLSASSESINVLIRALQESRRLDVLSRPQVMTLNNQPAFVLVGARVPRIQSTQLTQFGTINSTILENVGLLLGVTPRISPDGLVVMEIDAEKSELGPTNEGIPISINQNGDVIRSPIINTTVAQTTVSARSGQTVILGGLITKSQNTIARRVPFIGDIPVLGNLFRFDSVDQERTELLIIMTPYIVRKESDLDYLNQMESERMSWCLADAVNIHGEAALMAGGTYYQSGTTVIYPDLDPTVTPDAAGKSPTPAAAQPETGSSETQSRSNSGDSTGPPVNTLPPPDNSLPFDSSIQIPDDPESAPSPSDLDQGFRTGAQSSFDMPVIAMPNRGPVQQTRLQKLQNGLAR